ncbi:MAG: transcriptional regulator CynR [Betaproteobacteria bacterium]|nr:transcriptional regulator CynR [Betaproteobacteria bacterium]
MFPRSLRYLIAVAEHHSFTRAAEVLFVSQPTLSQQIKQLEDLLDVQLLDRTGRTVRLTAAGEVYLHHARRALDELGLAARAIHELQDLSRGSLRLGMTPITDYLATPLLNQFIARYPGISMNTLEMPQDDIVTALVEDRVDIGIAFNSTLSTEASSEEIDSHILFVETLCLAVGDGHPLAQEPGPLSKHALEQVPLVMLNNNYALRRHIDLFCHDHCISPLISMEATSLSVIIEIVRLGRLATLLPDTIACSQPGLYPISLLPELPRHTISLICRKGAHKSPACQAFAELAAEWTSVRCKVKRGHRIRPCPLSDVCTEMECTSACEAKGTADFSDSPPQTEDGPPALPGEPSSDAQGQLERDQQGAA